MQMQEPFQLVIFLRLGKLMYTPLCNRASGIYILTGFTEKTSPNFPPGCPFPFSSSRCFAFFKGTQTTYAGYVNVAPGKPQTGRVKFKISLDTVQAKYSLVKRKQSTGSGLTGSVTEGCIQYIANALLPMQLFPFSVLRYSKELLPLVYK